MATFALKAELNFLHVLGIIHNLRLHQSVSSFSRPLHNTPVTGGLLFFENHHVRQLATLFNFEILEGNWLAGNLGSLNDKLRIKRPSPYPTQKIKGSIHQIPHREFNSWCNNRLQRGMQVIDILTTKVTTLITSYL